MLCPNCFTSWDNNEEYLIHLEAHGVDVWRCQQLRKDLSVVKPGSHGPAEECKCPMWGSRFECELRIYRAR